MEQLPQLAIVSALCIMATIGLLSIIATLMVSRRSEELRSVIDERNELKDESIRTVKVLRERNSKIAYLEQENEKKAKHLCIMAKESKEEVSMWKEQVSQLKDKADFEKISENASWCMSEEECNQGMKCEELGNWKCMFDSRKKKKSMIEPLTKKQRVSAMSSQGINKGEEVRIVCQCAEIIMNKSDVRKDKAIDAVYDMIDAGLIKLSNVGEVDGYAVITSTDEIDRLGKLIYSAEMSASQYD